jgi:hypothetical protein
MRQCKQWWSVGTVYRTNNMSPCRKWWDYKNAHKLCVVTNAATIWIFQNNNRISNAARKAATQSCSVEVDIRRCVPHSEVSNIICHLMQCRICVDRYGGMWAKTASFQFPCALSQGDTSQSTAIRQLVIIIIIIIYLLSYKKTFSGMCLLGFFEVHTTYTSLKCTLFATHSLSCKP